MTVSHPYDDPKNRFLDVSAGLSRCGAVDAEGLRPEIAAVERYFGGSRYAADSGTKDRIAGAIDIACRIASPMMTFAIRPIRYAVRAEKIELSCGRALPLPEDARDFSSGFLAAAIGTLGKGLETECRHLAAQRRIFQSTLLDAVGTAMLDILGINIAACIDSESHSLELCSGVRFAPGLNGYPLDHQKTLFELADGVSIHVKINADRVMDPVKTISFFTLLGAPDGRSRHPEKCRQCKLSHCQFRKGTTSQMEG